MDLGINFLTEIAKEIMTQGYDLETASNYAARIGDCHGYDENGKLIVLDERGKIIARLQPLKCLSKK